MKIDYKLMIVRLANEFLTAVAPKTFNTCKPFQLRVMLGQNYAETYSKLLSFYLTRVALLAHRFMPCACITDANGEYDSSTLIL